METTTTIARIKATDVPLARLSEDDLDALVRIEAFQVFDDEYRNSLLFRQVLANHTRLVDFQKGDIIVREGDWGSTAFFIVSGRVLVASPDAISDEALGRRASQRKGLFAALAQRWTNHRNPEFRDINQYEDHQGVGIRGQRSAAQIYLQDVPAVIDRSSPMIVLEQAQMFGEIAALGRTARTATLVALSDCQLLEVRWQGLRTLLKRDSAFRELVENKFRENSLNSFLLASPVFQHLRNDQAAMDELLAGTHLETYGEYDNVGTFRELATAGAAKSLTGEPVIAAEGDYPNGLIMIRGGVARVSRRHHSGHLTVNYLSPGQMYGFAEIAEGYRHGTPSPQRYSLRAIGYVTVVCVPTPLVEKYLLPGALEPSATIDGSSATIDGSSATIDGSSATIDGSSATSAASGDDPAAPSRLDQGFREFLLEERLINGTQSMLINLDRCTRCDDCVRACASTHDNNPRFVRQGPIHDNVMVANACMHCQDPVCMIECPTGAISRREEGGFVEINDLTCIGCGTCAGNCPYDAIRMMEIRDANGAFIRDTTTHLPIVKATKCDLCADQWGGPACQRACPHDALARIDMRDIQRLAEWKNR